MKKTFKLFAACALAGAALVYTGCTKDYAEDIKGLDDRLTAVEKSVSELQSQIKAGAVITDVTSTTNGVKVTLSNGKSFEITNGKDGANGKDGVNGTNGTNGKDGQDGKPGSVITIGENGNWYIDDKDTGKPSRGENGKDGVNGTNGTNGTNGADGKDADQVYFKPGSNGCWIKVTVTPDGQVTEEQTTESFLPEGTITAVWENGALTLYGVENSPFDEPLVIDLAGLITSLAYMPETLLDSRGVIDFVNFYVDGESVGTLPATAKYRVNPSSANISEEGLLWNFASRSVKTRAAAAAQFEIVGAPFATRIPGQFEVKIKAVGELPMQCTYDELSQEDQLLGALAVTRPDGGVIISDEAYVQQTKIDNYSIINAELYDETTAGDISRCRFSYQYVDAETSIANGTSDIKLVHNSSINIYDYLETMCFSGIEAQDVISDYDINYEYVVTPVDVFKGQDGETNQQVFVKMDEDGKIYVDKSYVSGTKAAIGRTPLFKVVLKIEGAEAAVAYIRVGIVDETPAPVDPEEFTITLTKDFNYSDLNDPWTTNDVSEWVSVDWDTMNRQILSRLNMSNTDFITYYYPLDYKAKYYDEDGEEIELAPDGVEDSWWGASTTTDSDRVAVFNINNQIEEDCSGSVVYEFVNWLNPSMPHVFIEFKYTVSHDHNWPKFSGNYYNEATNTVTVKGRKVGSSWKMYSGIKEHFYGYLAEYEFADNQTALGFALPKVDEDGNPLALNSTEGTAQAGVELSTSPVELADEAAIAADASDIKLSDPVSLDGKIVWVTMYEKLANGNICEKSYKVKFVSPFIIEASSVELDNLLSGASTVDLMEKITVKENGGAGRIIYKGSDTTPFKTAVANDYGLNASDFNYVFSLAYPYKPEVEFNGDRERLKITGTTVSWENNGANLLQNMKAQYKVVMTLPEICTANAKADIIIKKN